MGNAKQLIALSVTESRHVTEYPDTQAEYDAIVDGLRVECGDDCEGAEASGEGHSGAEARGSIEYWGTNDDGHDWRVSVVRPEAP